MKIVIDAFGATEYAGGMTLHALEIIKNWAETYPEDQIHVITGASLKKRLGSIPNVKVAVWPNESILFRAPGQIIGTAALGLLSGADYVISLSPIVSPLVPKSRSGCFQHDWRHLKNPEEFSRLNKVYRLLWALSAKTSGTNFCISTKAVTETLEVAPRAQTLLVENGRDHARRWKKQAASTVSGTYAVTFGHHNNKRPELTIQAFTQATQGSATEKLVVLGARGEYADELKSLAESVGVADRVVFPGFVTDEQYEEILSNASVVVMASSDEGFGLPAAEAEYFGIPTVVTEDSGMQDIFTGLLVAAPTPQELGQAIRKGFDMGRTRHLENNEALWTWADAVRTVRSSLLARKN